MADDDLELKTQQNSQSSPKEVIQEQQETTDNNTGTDNTGPGAGEGSGQVSENAEVKKRLSHHEKLQQVIEEWKPKAGPEQQKQFDDYIESSQEVQKLLKEKERIEAEQRDLAEKLAQAKKNSKELGAQILVGKKSADLGISKINKRITEERLADFNREECLKILLKDGTDLQVNSADFLKDCLGNEKSKDFEHRSATFTARCAFNILFHAFAGQFKEMKEMLTEQAAVLNEIVDQHNACVGRKIQELQNPKKPTFAQMVSQGGAANKKKLAQFLKPVIQEQMKTREQEVTKHNNDRRKTILQILASHVPEIPDDVKEGKNREQLAQEEAKAFVNFTNNFLSEYRGKKGNKPVIQTNQLMSLKRLEWPKDHKGIQEKWPRLLKVTFNPGQEDRVAFIIAKTNDKVAKRNWEIHNGEKKKEDRIPRCLQVQLTDLQKKNRKKIQEWCNRDNAANWSRNKNCKLWFVKHDLNGDPFRYLQEDRHPDRTEEMMVYWKQYLPGRPKHKAKPTGGVNNNEHRPHETSKAGKGQKAKNPGMKKFLLSPKEQEEVLKLRERAEQKVPESSGSSTSGHADDLSKSKQTSQPTKQSAAVKASPS